MANSKRKCGGCGEYFRLEADQTFPGPVSWCNPDCGLVVARNRLPAIKKKQEREAKALHQEAKERIKTTSQCVSDVQKVVNEIVVLEDKEKGCISCVDGVVTDSGHYFHRGSKYRTSPLTLDRRNLNGQCRQCNGYKGGGNQHEYRLGFIERYGQERFDSLCEYKRMVDRKEVPPLTKDDCKVLLEQYRDKLKQLKTNTR